MVHGAKGQTPIFSAILVLRPHTKIHILPIEDTIEGLSGDLTKTYLIPYFKDAYRPVKKGDLFVVRGNFKPV